MLRIIFRLCVQTTTSSAEWLLGVIFRIARESRCPDVFLTLFSSSCRSRLECSSVVGKSMVISDFTIHISTRSAKKMSCVLFHRHLCLSQITINSTVIANLFHLDTLSHRRFVADIMFLFERVYGQSDTFDLLASLSLRTSRYNSISTSTLYPRTKNYLYKVACRPTS